MGSKLDNALALYLDGVRDGLLEPALDKYVSDALIQHSVGVADGRHGLLGAYAPRIAKHASREIWPLRGFQDGRKVFLQTYQNWGRGAVELVSCDIFDTDSDDRIIEHWNVTSPLAGWSASGRSQIDGPSLVDDWHATAANKRLVRDYLTRVLIADAPRQAAEHLCRDFVQHSPRIHDGVDGQRRHFDRMCAEGAPVRYREIAQLVGKGNFVASLCRVEIAATTYAVIDLFRVEAGQIAEHWDVACEVVDTGVNRGAF